ncbi:hypothetical protein J7S33_09510 [Saccharothrix algeriensis]|uniref:Uncharacterized protein n=1 Tax=Saccharothrix algeriensis TaxID=173560 RepID=A0A8T8I2M3_9PSEU|nr:hypothetical protein J7S33_09510 [Saccharothrix algeriensis]
MPAVTTENAHLGTALTGGAVLFVLLRLLAVSHYDWHTTFALLHTLDLEDAPGLFLGTFMADRRISTVLLVLMVPLAAFYAAATRSRYAPLVVTVLVAFLVAHVRTYHQWWVPVTAVVLAAGLVVSAIRRKGDEPGPVRFVVRRIGLVVGVVALVVAAVVATPWVPRERIETTTGTFEVYVVETSPGFLKVLGAQGHEFRILRDDEVLSRVELADH